MIKTSTAAEFADAVKAAKAADGPMVIYVETDPLVGAPDSESWWDVPVSATSTLESTQAARTTYEQHKHTQRPLITPATSHRWSLERPLVRT